MSADVFELKPFPSLDPPELQGLSITGIVQRSGQWLTLRYVLSGQLSNLLIPPAEPVPQRQDQLWQATCFEFFLSTPAAAPYWEFNMSPSGHWNVYRFSDYRADMQAEPLFQMLPFALDQTVQTLTLDLHLDISPIVPTSAPIQMAISAVVEPRQRLLSYWALTHPALQADFHARDSFVIEL